MAAAISAAQEHTEPEIAEEHFPRRQRHPLAGRIPGLKRGGYKDVRRFEESAVRRRGIGQSAIGEGLAAEDVAELILNLRARNMPDRQELNANQQHGGGKKSAAEQPAQREPRGKLLELSKDALANVRHR